MSTIDQERAADCIDTIVEAVFTDEAVTAVDFDEGDAAAIAIDLAVGRERAAVVVYPVDGAPIVHTALDARVLSTAAQLRDLLAAAGERAFTALVLQLVGDDVIVGFAHDDDHPGGWPLANARDDLLIEALRPRPEAVGDDGDDGDDSDDDN
ncbi:MAG TPA: hypothetical protein VGF99_00410 [Myxococcota bacterium]